MVREWCSASEQHLSLSVPCTTRHRNHCHMLLLGDLMLVLVVNGVPSDSGHCFTFPAVQQAYVYSTDLTQVA